MRSTDTNRQLFTTTLIAISVLCALFSVSIFRYMKGVEARFKKEKRALVMEKMQLKDSFDSLQRDIGEKNDSIAVLEKEKREISAEADRLKRELSDSVERENRADEALKKEAASLREIADSYKNNPLMQFIKEALTRETDENVKRILADTMNKLSVVKGGGTVALEPVVVNAEGGEGPGQGKVLSVDAKSSLMVIDLGRMQGAKEGQRCSVYDGAEKIGSAYIIKTRYKISAVFIESIQPRHSIKDFKEGNLVTLE